MPQRLCRRVDCPNPVVGRKFYCSKQCSAKTRNRRYYNTISGRRNKRCAASRYFQRNRENVYQTKRERFERYINEILDHANEHNLFMLSNSSLFSRSKSGVDRVMTEARKLARVKHDWHGTQWGDGPMGRPIWQMLDPALFVRKTKQAVPGRKTNREEYLSVKAFIRRFQKVQSLRHY